jgi:gliding motility-associated-like protein
MIGTQNFNPDANSTFLWHDGSTGSEYLVKADDTIAWVTVYYADDCFYRDSIDIDHLPSPSVDVGPDTEMCMLDTLFPYQHSNNVSYLWQDGSSNPWIIATNSGFYGLTVTNEFGCQAYDELLLDVLPSPIVNLGNDTIINAGEQLILDAQNPGASYFWSTGDTTRSIIAGSNQTYWVDVSKDGCSAFDTIFIDEYPPCILAVPTAFSPNGDGQNDILYVRGDDYKEFELMIFSRWGELVFQTSDNSIGWDGTFKGQAQAVDAYNYVLKGVCLNGQITMTKGTITLIR